MELLDLYIDNIINAITGGTLVKKDNISSVGLKVSYERIVTKKLETKVWVVTSIPLEYGNNLTQGIRQKMFKEFPNVITIIDLAANPTVIGVNSGNFQRRFMNVSDYYESIRDAYETLGTSGKVLGKSFIDPKNGRKIYVNKAKVLESRDRYDSLSYIHETENAGKKFSNSFYFIQASCDNILVLRSFGRRLAELCLEDGIKIKDLKGKLFKYLNNFGVGNTYKEAIRGVDPLLFSTENAVSLLPYATKGLVNGIGLPMGCDVDTGLPFFIDLFGTPAAQIFAIYARTGGGKTGFVVTFIMHLIGVNNHASVTDFKGNEWQNMAKLNIETLRLDMEGENAVFVNTLRLDDLPDYINHRDMFQYAITGTINILKLMANISEKEGNPSDVEMLIEKAVRKLYNISKIDPERPETFRKTRTLTYTDVLEQLSNLELTKSFSEQQRSLCSLIKTRCSIFFSSGGKYESSFKNEITVTTILDTPLVVYAFNKNTNAIVTLVDAIRTFMVVYLDGKKQAIRKILGLFTWAVYEELSRFEKMDTLVEYISQQAVGSRSANVGMFLMFNSASTVNLPKFANIKSSITTNIIGKLNEVDRKEIIENSGLRRIEDYINKVTTSDEEKYRYSFVVDYDTGNKTGTSIVKSTVPEYILEEFITRTTDEK